MVARLARVVGLDRRLAGRAIHPADALPLFAADHFVLGGGQTESVGLLFAVVGVGLVASSTRLAWLALGGVALGMAVLISVQFGPALLGALAVAVLARDHRFARTAVVIAGSALIPVLSVAWIGANGVLPQMIEQVLTYNRAYLAGNQQFRDRALLWVTGDALFLLPVIGAAVVRVVGMRRERPTTLEIAATAWLGVGVLLLIAQGLFFDHYLTALGPPLVILSTPSLATAFMRAHRLDHPAVATGILIGVLAIPAIVGLAITEASAPAASPSPAVADRIRAVTRPGDPVFVWGKDASLYLDADRPLGSRFVYMFPLTAVGYATPELVAGIVDAWDTRPPRLIVDATRNPGRVGGYPLEPTTDPAAPDALLDPLRHWVLEHYRLVDTVNGWGLYEENGST
jgi:4-amino-4-deoxy-L-arabinose transferase-like glycosyltransferase